MVVEHHDAGAGDHIEQRLLRERVEHGTHVARTVGEGVRETRLTRPDVAATVRVEDARTGAPATDTALEVPLQTELKLVGERDLHDAGLDQDLGRGEVEPTQRGLDLLVLGARRVDQQGIVEFVGNHLDP